MINKSKTIIILHILYCSTLGASEDLQDLPNIVSSPQLCVEEDHHDLPTSLSFPQHCTAEDRHDLPQSMFAPQICTFFNSSTPVTQLVQTLGCAQKPQASKAIWPLQNKEKAVPWYARKLPNSMFDAQLCTALYNPKTPVSKLSAQFCTTHFFNTQAQAIKLGLEGGLNGSYVAESTPPKEHKPQYLSSAYTALNLNLVKKAPKVAVTPERISFFKENLRYANDLPNDKYLFRPDRKLALRLGELTFNELRTLEEVSEKAISYFFTYKVEKPQKCFKPGEAFALLKERFHSFNIFLSRIPREFASKEKELAPYTSERKLYPFTLKVLAEIYAEDLLHISQHLTKKENIDFWCFVNSEPDYLSFTHSLTSQITFYGICSCTNCHSAYKKIPKSEFESWIKNRQLPFEKSCPLTYKFWYGDSPQSTWL